MRSADEEGSDPRVMSDRVDSPELDELSYSHNPSEDTRFAQERFLNAFPVSITDREAREAVGISATTLAKWKRGNVGGFMDRYRVAAAERIGNLEELAFDVVRYFGEKEERYEKILRYPTLLLRLLSAHDPRYKNDTVGQGEDAKRTMEILSGLSDTPPVQMTPQQDIEDQLDDIFKPKS